MVRETTPPTITPVIVELCKFINKDIPPFYVDVIPEPYALQNECFPNVQAKIMRDGGTYINGWAIWQWGNALIDAEAHSLWQSDDGRLVDITPHSYGEKQILFVPDTSVEFEGVIIPNKRAPLTTSPTIARLIDLCNTKDYILQQSGTSKTCAIPKVLIDEILRLQIAIRQEVSQNDLCPCGSGLKYKKCCGPYEHI